MNPVLAASDQMYLLIIGLTSGTGIIALIVKFLLATPEREASAYKRGIEDERTQNTEELRELKLRVKRQEEEIATLRNGLLNLVVEAKFTIAQKREIAKVLGFKSLAQLLDSEKSNPE